MYTYVNKIKSKFLSKDCIYWLLYYFIEFFHLSRFIPDKIYVCLRYRCAFSESLDLNNPVTFNEKLNWLKLNDRNPLYTTLVDKLAVKMWASNIIGDKYIIRTMKTWENVEDIVWEELPQQFVIKWNHDSGSIVICKDKKSFDVEKAKRKLKIGQYRDGYLHAREWPYKNVRKTLLMEEYLEDDKTKELRDYKFFCYNGDVKFLFVASDRQRRQEPYFDFFDSNFNLLPIKQGHPNSPTPPEKPVCFEEMKLIASKLSNGIPHVRIDLYEVNGKIYFGEITFFHFGGLVPFEPKEWDKIFGNFINLNLVYRK